MEMRKDKPIVYVVSDAAGETGESVVRAAAIQFYPVVVEIRRLTYILNKSDVDRVIQAAHEENALIVFTLVVPELRDYLTSEARKHNVIYIDILGPVISSLEQVLHKPARHQPGMIHQLDEDYFKKVEAVEFAVKYDDGRDPAGVLKADIILIGVSRTSKTPLSMYLAHKKYKVANVPLVPELKPTELLFSIPKNKVIGLKISPDKLNEIRKERLRTLGLDKNAMYANHDRISYELEYAEEIMNRIGCTVIDVSNKAVEETASLIMNLLFGKS
ncbi:MAG: phosphoenolpyruvate synthase regulatory protein [Paenibacillus sp. RIFOXYA1_FULL_44_5]|nr:MAG: phosphoenolpyruvate synthase regulatory protein [Paenibacillus sp. RIFOXYA1_FULL_44_5]